MAATHFGGEDWSNEWPEEAEAGCLAACFSDWKATDSAAKITGLAHAYLSVAANEGITLFYLLLVFGSFLGALSVWLLLHIIHTKQLVLIIPLSLASLLTLYCWAFLAVKYRFRRLCVEIFMFCCRWPFVSLRRLGLSLATIATATPRILAFWVAKFVVIRPPRYRESCQEKEEQVAILCFACRRMVSKSRLLTGSSKVFHLVKATENWEHHSLRGLQQSATKCHLCKLLLRSAPYTTDSVGLKGGQQQSAKNNSTVLQESQLTIKLWEERSWAMPPSMRMQLQGMGIEETRLLEILAMDSESTLAFSNDVLPSFDTKLNWEFAKEWIASCQSHEPCCNSFMTDTQSTFLPKRLLKITLTSPSNAKCGEKEVLPIPSIRLVDTADLGPSELSNPPSYVALSHFFGDIAEEPMISQLRTTNLEKLKISVSLQNLPPLFQDAVYVAANTGFTYLWVDTLCILQDSEEDQLSGAAQRGLVFANAACTVSTTAPSSPGFPSHDAPGAIETRCRILVGNDNRRSLVIRAGSPLGHVEATEIDQLFRQYVDSQALSRWSWTSFQDRLLSRRIIHLGGGGVVLFECNTMRATNHPQYLHGVPYSRRPSFTPEHNSVAAPSSRNLLKSRETPIGPSSNTGLMTKELQGFSPLELSRRSELSSPVSVDFSLPGKTYRYHTRRKTIDRASGAFKFETLVVAGDHNLPLVQEALEELQFTSTWRRHRGSFERLLRPTLDLKNYMPYNQDRRFTTGKITPRTVNALALHNSWFSLVKAYSSSSSLINKGSSDRNHKRLMGLNSVAEFISQRHKQDNFGLVLGPYVCGLWLETLAFNLLWFRTTPVIVSTPRHVDPEFFAKHDMNFLHYQAPPGSLDARHRSSSEWKIPSWSWASLDGQISHKLPDSLDTKGARSCHWINLNKFFQLNGNAKQARKPKWNAISQLIDQRVEVFDHWTQVIPDMTPSTGAIILPRQFSSLKLRIRSFYPLFNLTQTSYESKGVHVFYDSIDRLHQAVYPGLNIPEGAEGGKEQPPMTRAVFGLPILEFCHQGQDYIDKSERQLHGLALKLVRTIEGRGDVFERVGYFCTDNEDVIKRVLCQTTCEGVVWLQ